MDTDPPSTHGDALRLDLIELKNDLDALVAHQAALSDTELTEAYARIMARLHSTGDLAKTLAKKTQQSAPSAWQNACNEIQQQPLRAGLLALLAGAVLEPLCSRRHQQHRHE